MVCVFDEQKESPMRGSNPRLAVTLPTELIGLVAPTPSLARSLSLFPPELPNEALSGPKKKSCHGDSILGSGQRESIWPDGVSPNRFTPIIRKLSFWVANPGENLVSHFRCEES